jgi:hypothetical protein
VAIDATSLIRPMYRALQGTLEGKGRRKREEGKHGCIFQRVWRAAYDESGHTLAETLVALTLFTAVLIPLLTAIGSLTVDDRAGRTQEALRLAQAELPSFDAPGSNDGDTWHTEHGLQVLRRITKRGELIEAEVIVTDTRKGGRTLVHLAQTSVQARSR